MRGEQTPHPIKPLLLSQMKFRNVLLSVFGGVMVGGMGAAIVDAARVPAAFDAPAGYEIPAGVEVAQAPTAPTSAPQVQPNTVAQPDCWFPVEGEQDLIGFDCQISDRINANGHRVWDVVDQELGRIAVVIWDDGTAEFFWQGKKFDATWSEDRQYPGEIRIMNNYDDFEFIFTLQ